MDDILSPSFLYGVILIGILIILYLIIRTIRKIRQASNPDEVWKLKFFLGGVGIIVAIVTVWLTFMGNKGSSDDRKVREEVHKDEAINRNWDVVYTREATSIRRTKALQNLARLGESFKAIDLSCAKIEGKPQKPNNIPKCDMGKVPLKHLDLSPEAIGIEKGVNLQEAKLMNVNLFEANLRSADLGEADFTGADLGGVDLTGANLEGVDLTGANLEGVDLTGANLEGVNLTGANLTDAFLYKANLTSAFLYKANLTDADLGWSDLTSADLEKANFTSAYLFKVNLTSADLVDTDLTAANLSITNFSEATISEDTVLDYTWVWEGFGTESFPIGNPKDWDTTLKPKYICPLGFYISDHIKVSEYSSEEEEQEKLKNALGQIIEKNCEPYTNARE